MSGGIRKDGKRGACLCLGEISVIDLLLEAERLAIIDGLNVKLETSHPANNSEHPFWQQLPGKQQVQYMKAAIAAMQIAAQAAQAAQA